MVKATLLEPQYPVVKWLTWCQQRPTTPPSVYSLFDFQAGNLPPMDGEQ
jgi:hypothetical protein